MSCLNNQNFSLIRSNTQQRQFNDVPNQHQNVSNNNESGLVQMLNNINKNGTVNTPPTKKLIELNPQLTYKVLKFKTVKTKYGNKCIAEVLDPIDNKVWNVFLPDRFSNTPPNNNLLGVFLNYCGMKDTYKGDTYHDINFSYLCPQH